jgi:RsiW-degrading membrane proteinase PrsW (M82 family)
MLKKALVIGALVGLGFAGTANAAISCFHAEVHANEHSVVQDICTPV